MKNKKLLTVIVAAVALVLVAGGILLAVLLGGQSQNYQIVIEGDLQDGAVMEYTGDKIQFPVAHVAKGDGRIHSYSVEYKIVNLADSSVLTDEYATFTLKTGSYQIIYSYIEDKNVSKTVSFSIQDTTSPKVEFIDIPNGLFLQNITEDTVNKLPLYSIEDASVAEGIDLTRVLQFKGDDDEDFREYQFREINNSYAIEGFGTFRYVLTATDVYGNETVAEAQWKVKDRDWLPEQLPAEGILADYSVEGYCNLVESGDANQYYKIGDDYSDTWLEEFEGAQGVLKIRLPFNNSVGWGNNTIRLRLPKTFTKEDLEGKYLAVRIYVEGEHLKDSFLFAGNNVEFRSEDATTRAFSTGVTGLKTGQWMTFYIEAATAEHIGMYPNATYNPNTTFYEGGDPSDALQLCFHREAGYFNDMILYVDSVSIAQHLSDTEITISGKEATWTPVEGAVGYRVNLNGEETIIQETKADLPGEKGYIRVTPLGNGATTLDSQTVTAVYGLDAGDSLAKFDDALYIDLFTDQLKFSTDAEHNGYRPQSYTGSLGSNGVTLELATGSWGVVTGIRFQFPNPQEKGSNTTLILNMNISNADYGKNIRIYDYDGKPMGTIPVDAAYVGQFHEYELDISSYEGKLKGIQLIFGPNESFTSVGGGVSLEFREIYLKNTYYPITVNGQSLMCAGTRELIPGYTNKDVVQFTTCYNFGVSYDDAPLSFSGTVLLDGKELKNSAVNVVGYPNTDTICFKVPHDGKILTIMKDSVIYYGGIAIEVENTFNARWDGSAWIPVAKIPDAPPAKYVTLSDGSQKLVENEVALEAGYTASGVVQFLNVYDFGVSTDDTPLGFEGIVMLDGELIKSPAFVGYPKNMTIALKVPHQGKLLTILKDSVIYYGDSAVVVKKTFNARWNGSSWSAVSEIPAIPETQYITLADGTTRELVGKVTLTPGFTMDSLVQFPDIYDFGAPEDSTPIGFEGTVLLQGREVTDPAVMGYKNSTTIGLERLNHKNLVVTVMEGAIIYNDTEAVLVKTTFNAIWDGAAWTNVAEIPEPEAPQEGTLSFEYRYGTANLIQVNTDLPTNIPVANFTTGDNGCSIDESANKYQNVGWIGMENVSGTIVLTFHFNNAFAAGQEYFLPAGAVFGFTDGSKFTLDQDYTFRFDGSAWTVNAPEEEPEEPTEPEETEPTEPEPSEPEEKTVSFQYRYGSNKLIQLNTDLPSSTPCVNFLTTDNGCSIDESANLYQQVGWIGMEKVGSTIVLTFQFNSAFTAGQTYTLPAGAVFGFTDGNKYALDMDYAFTFDGNQWTMTATEPVEPEPTEPTEPEPTEPEEKTLSFQYRYGTNNLIQLNTDLPSSTPCVNFLTTDNGCSIDESANQYQQVGWIGMEKVGSTIVLTFHFNSAFTAGQEYFLPAGAVFGFTDGNKYALDMDYAFTFDGNQWTMTATEPVEPEPTEPTEPEPTEPEEKTLSFQYRYGTNNLIQLNTDLPSSTPCVNFLTTDNGCSIDESANQYQQVGWIGMEKVGSTIVLTFHFNSAFTAGQEYFLPAGAVFGFTDGNKHTLDMDYAFTFDGTQWTMIATEPEEKTVSFQYRYGTNKLIQVNTDLPATTPCVNFLTTDNGCQIDESKNQYQNVAWISMEKVSNVIVLTFHFNSPFTAGQSYSLPMGAFFAFTDGSGYALDKNYSFLFNGNSWSVSES